MSFFKTAEKWPQNPPSPREMYLLIGKRSFRRRCWFLVYPTALLTKVRCRFQCLQRSYRDCRPRILLTFSFFCARTANHVCRNPIRDVGTQEELMHPRNARNASWRNQLEVFFTSVRDQEPKWPFKDIGREDARSSSFLLFAPIFVERSSL